MYADDTTIIVISKSFSGLQRNINYNLNNIYLYSVKNKLKLNLKKTKYMLFHTRANPINDNFTVVLNNTPLNKSTVLNY